MAENEKCLRFDGTKLQECAAPDWLAAIRRDASEHGGDMDDIYRRNGIQPYQQFGADLDSVSIYDARSRGYIIEYCDAAGSLATILIDDVAAYLEFRSKYLHAWVWLIAEMERNADSDYERARQQRRMRA